MRTSTTSGACAHQPETAPEKRPRWPPRRGISLGHLAPILALYTVFLSGCEERQRQQREYRSDPIELQQALLETDVREERLEILDLLGATEESALEDHPELYEPLRPLLADPDPVIAAKVGDVLARWQDPKAGTALLAMMRSADPWVRLSALTSLAILGDPSAVAAVAEATLDADENVRSQACRTLSDLRQPLVGRPHGLVRNRLRDDHASVRAAAANALGRVGNADDVSGLRVALRDSNQGVTVEAAIALGRLRDRIAIPALIEILRSGTQATRVAAAEALGRMRDPSAVPSLIEHLGYPDSIVRGEVMRSLSKLGDRRALVPLLALALDEDPLIQTFVPFTASKLYTPADFTRMASDLQSNEPEIRTAAAFSLGLAGEKRSIPLLRDGLRDPDHRVRMGCMSALGLLGTKDAISEIEDLLRNDPNPQVRDSAKVALAMVKIDASTLASRLIQGLSSEIPAVRLASTTLLTAIEEKKALAALRLRLDDTEELIRNAARYAVEQLEEL